MLIEKLLKHEAIAAAAGLAVALLMARPAAGQELCLPPHTGLPYDNGPPNVDGFVGREAGVDPAGLDASGKPSIDAGWAGAPLAAYHDGGDASQMELRAIAHNSDSFIYLSFVVRRDTEFDELDRISVVIDPDVTTLPATAFGSRARRLDIQPVQDGVGASTASGGAPFEIRKDAPPVNVEWLRFTPASGGGTWSDVTGPSTAAIKVRSWVSADKNWSVEIKLPITADTTSGWPDIGAQFGLYANVIRVCGTTATCASRIPGGFMSTQFTWPRADYSAGTRLITGTSESLKSLISSSLQPTWLGLARRAAAGTGGCAGVSFDGGVYGIGVRGTGTALGTNVQGPSAGVDNVMVARLDNNSGAPQPTVKAEFRIANWGIDRAGATWDKIPAVASVTTVPAGPLNAGSANSNPTSPATVPTTGGELQMLWRVQGSDNYCDAGAGPCPAGSRDAHSCIWVLLNSNAPADIMQSSVRRNFDIVNLSASRAFATIDGRDWGKSGAPGGQQEFKLFTHRKFLVHPGKVGNLKEVLIPKGIIAAELRSFGEQDHGRDTLTALERTLLETKGLGSDVLWNYVWMVDVSRATPLTMTVGSKTFQVYEPAGEFGKIGQHFGQIERLVDGLTGQGLTSLDADHHTLLVQDGQIASIGTVVAALKPGERLEQGPGPIKPCGGCTCCPPGAASQQPTTGLLGGMGLMGLVSVLMGRRRGRRTPA